MHIVRTRRPRRATYAHRAPYAYRARQARYAHEPDKPAAQIPINISATITRATEEAFESGDHIGLLVVPCEELVENIVVNRNADGSAATLKPLGNHLDNMPYTYTMTWNAEKTVYWKDAQTHADFYMYYPYTQTVASVSAMPFGVSADQSSLGAYKSSDLIVGSTLDAAPSASPVNIAARHLMSQVEIVLKAGAGYSESSLADADVSVKMNNLATSATVNLATFTVSVVGSVRSLTPYKDGAVYRAFVVPQTATGNNLITKCCLATVSLRVASLPSNRCICRSLSVTASAHRRS